jgi:hypothetical protein
MGGLKDVKIPLLFAWKTAGPDAFSMMCESKETMPAMKNARHAPHTAQLQPHEYL